MTAVAAASKGPTLRALFDRLDRNKNGEVEREEVAAHLKDLGIGKGLFGGQKIEQGTDAFMKKLDAGESQKVSWAQFKEKGATLLPAQLMDTKTQRLDPSKVDQVFDQMAGAGALLADMEAVRAFVAEGLKGKGAKLALLAGAISDGASRVVVDALDTDGDKKFSRQDLRGLVDDINHELA